MQIHAPRLGSDRSVALVSGGALVVANLVLLVRPVVLFGEASLISSSLVLVAYLVLAYGLPGHPGVLGSSGGLRLVRVALVLSGVLGLAVEIAPRLVESDDPNAFDGLGFRIYSSVSEVAELAGLFLLLAAAALAARGLDSGQAPGGRHDAVLGLRALALVALAGFAVDPLLFGALALSPLANVVEAPFAAVAWAERALRLAGIGIGVWFAWPFLGPVVARFRAVVSRAYRRYVDSTP